MFLSGRRMVLGLIVLAALVMVRGCMVMTGRGVMMLARRMFCHFSVLQLHRLDQRRCDPPLFPEKLGNGAFHYCAGAAGAGAGAIS